MTTTARAPSRGPLLVGAVTVAASLAVVPFEDRPLGPSVSFVPALLAVVAVCDVLSVYLLVTDFHDRGDRRLLALTAAYVWSLAMMVVYALAFPGALSARPPLHATPSLAPWSYVLWHGGFPALLGATWLPWPRRWSAPVPSSARHRVSREALTAAGGTSLAAALALVSAAPHLPVLIHGLDTSAMTRLTAPVALPLAAAALVASWRGTRTRTGPERWSVVAVLACCCDLGLTYSSQHRFSAGWYAGRTLTLAAAGVVVVATIGALRKARGLAEQDALHDSLTGLANRRSGLRDLDLLLTVGRRSGLHVSVLVIDIDHFKAVNDTYGHDVGDQVLCTVAAVLRDRTRTSDVACRLGGEEFLVVLPDTDLEGASECAQQLRSALADSHPAGIPLVTASIGVATQTGDISSAELIKQADDALYEAKHRGRNQVRVAARPPSVPRQRAADTSQQSGVRPCP